MMFGNENHRAAMFGCIAGVHRLTTIVEEPLIISSGVSWSWRSVVKAVPYGCAINGSASGIH
jgi:hypothetical protein